MIRGMILTESLIDQSYLVRGNFKIEERYPMLMDGIKPVEVVIISIEKSNLFTTLIDISKLLLPKGFYAHFVEYNLMYVVYPSTITVVEKGNKLDSQLCIELGHRFGIPEYQLPIDRMFEFRHSEHD
jgi:hypothetical protein